MRIGFAVAVIGLVLLAGCDSDPALPGTPVPTSSAGSIALGPSTTAGEDVTVDLRDSASTVHIALADTDGTLYRVATPPGQAHPSAAVSADTVAVTLPGGATTVDITLDEDVTWALRLSAGASTLTVDAADGAVSGLTTLAGVSAIDLTLAQPHGLVTLTEVGGASTLDLHVPDGTGVQVHAVGGAGTIVLFGKQRSGIAAGATVSSSGFAGAGYRIEAQGGVSSIVVDATDQ